MTQLEGTWECTPESWRIRRQRRRGEVMIERKTMSCLQAGEMAAEVQRWGRSFMCLDSTILNDQMGDLNPVLSECEIHVLIHLCYTMWPASNLRWSLHKEGLIPQDDAQCFPISSDHKNSPKELVKKKKNSKSPGHTTPEKSNLSKSPRWFLWSGKFGRC